MGWQPLERSGERAPALGEPAGHQFSVRPSLHGEWRAWPPSGNDQLAKPSCGSKVQPPAIRQGAERESADRDPHEGDKCEECLRSRPTRGLGSQETCKRSTLRALNKIPAFFAEILLE